jgi:hypothetical protein
MAGSFLDTTGFADELNEIKNKDPYPTTNKRIPNWAREPIFVAVCSTIIMLEIYLLFECIKVNPFLFDSDLWSLGQKVMVFPIVIAGMRASHNKIMDTLKGNVAKKEQELRDKVDIKIQTLQEDNKKLNTTIIGLERDNYKLRIELDVKSQVFEELTKANKLADKKIIEVKAVS